MTNTQWVSASQSDIEAKVEQRVLGQLIEAVLYEEIAVPLSGIPVSGFDGELVLQGQTAAGEPVKYRFKAKRKFTFDRIRIAREKIERQKGNGEWEAAQVSPFVEEVLGQVQPDQERLVMLQDELRNTFAKDVQAQTYRASVPESGQQRSYDELESLLDGHPYHPCYKSRIGFSAEENAQYGPEFRGDLQPVWLAVSKAESQLSLLEGEDYPAILRYELGSETYRQFESVLTDKGLIVEDYLFMPVHPWQWEHVIASAFEQQLAESKIVRLGHGADVYHAQQSIRSWANQSNKEKAYLKMALNITNTSTRRMLAKHTVLNAPLVSRWLLSLTENDAVAQKLGLVFLAEFAGITYQYEKLPENLQPQAYGNLGVVWRQSVHCFLKEGEGAIPLSSVTYIDGKQPFIEPWVQKYGIKAWTRQLLDVAITPLIHMLYAHGLAMESHAQNIVLLHKDGLPARLALKDFHDGLRFSKAQLPQPEACPDLNLEPAAHRAINRHSYMQTDDLDAVKDFLHSAFFFVCLGDIGLFLLERYGLAESEFWQMVADVIHQYQQEHPEHGANFEKYNLFSDTIRIEQLARRRLWKDMEVDPKHVPNPLSHFRFSQGGQA
ncbi:IucA/IucC family protein [Paenibacillus planticolens]|uniref:IucA/IucC family siderophore biosynthesis protein n=1 Tax=Paenibacillus planticolens TaxID=2654976 RepID=A0ABX2A057_9BACL|nr:IucA/IucC family protein [Paenibacillus planticolens]NOV04657.1 IucA/IucC family siderophore biosynthesis protein [Paenibacillus planticolens]